MGILRSRAVDEIRGLDIPEMGTPGYVSDGNMIPGGHAVPTPVLTPGMSAAGAD